MSDITATLIRQHAQETLNVFFEKKFNTHITALAKATEQENFDKVEELKRNLKSEKQKYDLDFWLENNLPRMLKGLKFGTHISKGIHPSSKGDNIFFKPQIDLSESLIVGSHILDTLTIDANGNAAYLQLASFLETAIANTTLQELIISDSEALECVFHKNSETSLEIQKTIKDALINIPKTPLSDDLNKHLLWPIGKNAINEDNYVNLIPLHPSSLVNNLFKTIQNIKFDEEITKAKDNRRKEQTPYINYPTIHDLAIINRGGSNAQNVGKLTAQQKGRNYLLPSYPPIFSETKPTLLKHSDKSIFNNALKHACRFPFNTLKKISKSNINNLDIRFIRANALDEILMNIFFITDDIQRNWSPGWSEKYSLNKNEKIWLDPDSHKNEAITSDWTEEIAHHFAQWLNQWLQKGIKSLKDEFSSKEYTYWKEEMHDILKAKQKVE